MNNASLVFEIFLNRLFLGINRFFNNYLRGLIKPWLKVDVIRKIKVKNRLEVRTKKLPNKQNLLIRYKNLCRGIKSDINSLKNDYFNLCIANCSGKLWKEWKLLNSLINGEKKWNGRFF